jgi:hypothetical protein
MTLLASPALAADCGKLATSTGTVGYCITPSERSLNPDVLYYFHGAAIDTSAAPEKAWSGGDARLAALWREMRIAAPTVITVSWGATWVLKDEKPASFETEIVPALEARLPAARSGRRLVLGGSMGGLNAFLAWTRLPHLFDAAAFQCPAFTPLGPQASLLERLDFARKMPGSFTDNLAALGRLRELFAPHFGSTEEWRQHQPAEAMRQSHRTLPPAYLVYDTADNFGFNGAPEIGAAGQPIRYEAVAGAHCVGVATRGLARFLAGRSRDARSAAPAVR